MEEEYEFNEPEADTDDERTTSFILRFWIEEPEDRDGPPTWRGHITHVVSRERRYLRTLEDIAAFIVPFLERLGVRFEQGSRRPRWLRW